MKTCINLLILLASFFASLNSESLLSGKSEYFYFFVFNSLLVSICILCFQK